MNMILITTAIACIALIVATWCIIDRSYDRRKQRDKKLHLYRENLKDEKQRRVKGATDMTKT